MTNSKHTVCAIKIHIVFVFVCTLVGFLKIPREALIMPWLIDTVDNYDDDDDDDDRYNYILRSHL